MSWTNVEDTTATSKTTRRCYLCNRPIPVGERHIERSGFDEGEPCIARFHVACVAKTKGWEEDDWLAHDPRQFREIKLGEGSQEPCS